jgi:hypothetical protein
MEAGTDGESGFSGDEHETRGRSHQDRRRRHMFSLLHRLWGRIKGSDDWLIPPVGALWPCAAGATHDVTWRGYTAGGDLLGAIRRAASQRNWCYNLYPKYFCDTLQVRSAGPNASVGFILIFNGSYLSGIAELEQPSCDTPEMAGATTRPHSAISHKS